MSKSNMFKEFEEVSSKAWKQQIQFDLNGKFISMPKCEGMKNFPSIEDDLDEIQVKQWKGFIFSSLKMLII